MGGVCAIDAGMDGIDPDVLDAKVETERQRLNGCES
jgi:hypothetical protein